jgi:Arc/MetJ family transcription regulator
MATNLDLDPALVDEAVAVGGRRTKKEAVTEALRERSRFAGAGRR